MIHPKILKALEALVRLLKAVDTPAVSADNVPCGNKRRRPETAASEITA
jgi:hypothetical protein